MNIFRKICLCLKSNASKYEIMIFDGCRSYNYVIHSRCKCICVISNQSYLDIYARPLIDEYENSLCFSLDVCNRSCLDIGLLFNRKEETRKYDFYLNDKKYGLPIEGILYFNSR